MQTESPTAISDSPSRASLAAALEDVRRRTLLLVEPLSEDALSRQHHPLMSPIVWDLGHIGAFEELWLVKRPGEVTTEADLEEAYDAFRTPRSARGDLDLPASRVVLERMAAVRREALEKLSSATLDPSNPLLKDGFAWEMVRQHEAQHQETILQTIQLMTSEDYRPPDLREAPAAAPSARPGEMVRVPAGRFEMGAPEGGFAYDNERPRNVEDVAAFEIGRYPVTNGEYAEFIAAGGYLERGLWTEAGWQWRVSEGLHAPQFWIAADEAAAPIEAELARDLTTADGLDAWRRRTSLGTFDIDPLEPVIHVCAHEADAFARFAAARLPSETEWEKAAAWDPATGRSRRYPWGDQAPRPDLANLDQLGFGPNAIGSYPSGRSAVGCEQMLGDAWEWTSSTFAAYDGFRAYPYPEYSEVFFGPDHRVLRGASWTTRPAVARNTFRNWDYPIRRQIFAGFRLARDA
jgi:iron(II)-dependent oxidoreductase